ncbi:MAG: helix-turn-helix domain-containing protein [Proteobacteria bacterium]|nr:helix-turn-helix domain-containing protein [Pseudomonadota bacterium]
MSERKSNGYYMINDVSRQVNLSQKRIREYEKEGFIRPEREPRTNNRLYTPFDVLQIKRINQLIHERGFTLACLRNLMVLAPCWNVFDCRLKHECAAHDRPDEPCWLIREDRETKCPGPCQKCAIYNNRDFQAEKILDKEYATH